MFPALGWAANTLPSSSRCHATPWAGGTHLASDAEW